MKLDRIRNAKRGIVFGTIGRLIGIVLSFLVQSLTIRKLGIEYAGIRGLFSSILSVLSLAELGIGSAIVYAMYKPIAEDDMKTICALMNLYKKTYRIIGFIIFLLGVAITPFLHLLVKDSYPSELNIKIVFWLYLGNTVLSYWLYAYKSCLLTAYQRNDVSSILGILSTIVVSLAQILILCLSRNFYFFLASAIFGTIINNLAISITVNRMYPELKCAGMVSSNELKEIKKKVAGLLIGKVCGVTRNSFDSIFMSVLMGLTQAAIYTNYYQIIVSVNSLVFIVLGSLSAGIGNGIALNGKKKNYDEMMLLNNLYLVFSGILLSFMICLYQPFMSLWVGERNLFPEVTMVLFPLYFYITKMGDIRSLYSEGAGLFWEDRWRSILEMIGNVVLNYVLGKAFGAAGIVLATLISLFVFGFVGAAIVAFKYYFKNGLRRYFLTEAVLFFSAITIGSISYSLCRMLSPDNTLVSLFIRGMICLMITPVSYWLLFHKTNEYKEVVSFCKNNFYLFKHLV